MSKKIRKVVAKFDLGHQLGKKLGLPDPSGDLLYGSDKALSPAEQAQKQAQEMAKQQAEQAEQQMRLQVDAANIAANQAASSISNSQQRDALSEQIKEAAVVAPETPTVELAGDIAPTTTSRKKFRSQIGGASGSPSVRV